MSRVLDAVRWIPDGDVVEYILRSRAGLRSRVSDASEQIRAALRTLDAVEPITDGEFDDVLSALSENIETDALDVSSEIAWQVRSRDPQITTGADLASGAWVAPGFHNRKRRGNRVHFYPGDDEYALCMKMTRRPDRGVIFHPETGLTDVDPAIGQPQQWRRACQHCASVLDAYAASSDAASEPGVIPIPQGIVSVDFLGPQVWDDSDITTQFAVTRSMGTTDGVLRLAVDPSRVSTDRAVRDIIWRFSWSADELCFVS